MFIAYIHGDSPIHRLNAVTKVCGFIVLTVLAFLFKHPLHNLVIAVGVAILVAMSGLSLKRLQQLISPLVPIFLLIMVFTGFSYSRDSFVTPFAQRELIRLGRLGTVSVGGILFGLTLMLRMFVMVTGSSLLTLTTPLEEFLALLQKSRLPYEMSFVVGTAIRFVPTLEKRANMVLDAQKARGTRLDESGIAGRIRAYVPIMVPMIADGVRTSENLACAMLSRGFGAVRSFMSIEETRLEKRDYLVIAGLCIILALGIYGKVKGIGSL
jgi:energy-coupling factor transport system permease protein